MYAPMMLSKSASPLNPSARALEVSHAPGQLPTMRSIAGSRSQPIRAATSFPATRSSAATISRALTEIPPAG